MADTPYIPGKLYQKFGAVMDGNANLLTPKQLLELARQQTNKPAPPSKPQETMEQAIKRLLHGDDITAPARKHSATSRRHRVNWQWQ